MSQDEVRLEDIAQAPAELPQPVVENAEQAQRTAQAVNRLGELDAKVAELEHKLAEEKRLRDRARQDLSDARDELSELRRSRKTSDILDALMGPLASRIFWFMVAYCVFVGFALVLNAAGALKNEIDPSVLTYLVGSTAATVIGLVGTIVAGVFVGARK